MAAIAAHTALLFSYVILQFAINWPPNSTQATSKMVYTLVVQFRAKEGKDVEEKIRNKLIEASQTYVKDAEVVGWYVMQDHVDTRKWAIIERYERESSLKIHQANPYYAEFFTYMEPLTEQTDLFQFNELDTSEPVHVE